MSILGQALIHSSTLEGMQAKPVCVEVSIATGLPGFSIVGMPDASIQEAKERVRAAILSAGFKFPGDKVVINLAPSSVKKIGSGFDLPIAVSLLIATHQLPRDTFSNKLIVGELALDGTIREVPGLLAHALCAKAEGLDFLTTCNQNQLIGIDANHVYGIDKLRNLREIQAGIMHIPRYEIKESIYDYAEIYGHDVAKRALQIAAVGNIGVLMVGPPGSGKTMLASRMPTILSPLALDEMMEAAIIHSIANKNATEVLHGVRPFESPHHSSTQAGLIGGGSPISPGSISLAHNGVLFLDELSEFSPTVLQSLRQPIESGKVIINRAGKCEEYPSKFILIAASNPCPCGYYGDTDNQCRCTVGQVLNYQNRIGGPLLDRIPIHVTIGRLTPKQILHSGEGTSSRILREAVITGKDFADYRLASKPKDKKNAVIDVIEDCMLSDNNQAFFEKWASRKNLSARAIISALKIARAVADMDEQSTVSRNHVEEAMFFVSEGMDHAI